MRSTVLDGFAVNPGDLSWDFLSRFGEYSVYDSTPPELVAERLSGTDIVLTNRVKITPALLDSCKSIKFVTALGTGYDMIDVRACRENSPGCACARFVSQTSIIRSKSVCVIASSSYSGRNAPAAYRAGRLRRWTCPSSASLPVPVFPSIVVREPSAFIRSTSPMCWMTGPEKRRNTRSPARYPSRTSRPVRFAQSASAPQEAVFPPP